jgi:hypothetical protein
MMSEMRQAMISEDETVIEDELSRGCLNVLEQRLERVQSWGWPYSEIDFSPQVKAALMKPQAENNPQRKNKTRVLVS